MYTWILVFTVFLKNRNISSKIKRSKVTDYAAFSWWGIEDRNTALNGPSSARQRNANEMAFRWRAGAGPTLNARLVALWFSGNPDQYCKQTLYFFVIFQGDPDRLYPHLWIRPCEFYLNYFISEWNYWLIDWLIHWLIDCVNARFRSLSFL